MIMYTEAAAYLSHCRRSLPHTHLTLATVSRAQMQVGWSQSIEHQGTEAVRIIEVVEEFAARKRVQSRSG